MNQDTHQSVYRERLLEHLLIGELMRHSWLKHAASLEVSHPSIDRAGHDVVLEANGVTRHVQIKSSSLMGKTASQKVHIALASKPSGCVIWVRFDPASLALGPFLFFGSDPGEPLPDIGDLPIAKHTKADVKGVKQQRPNLRVVRKSRFCEISSVPELYEMLFGS